jgi:hypothetical protein
MFPNVPSSLYGIHSHVGTWKGDPCNIADLHSVDSLRNIKIKKSHINMGLSTLYNRDAGNISAFDWVKKLYFSDINKKLNFNKVSM